MRPSWFQRGWIEPGLAITFGSLAESPYTRFSARCEGDGHPEIVTGP